VERRPAGRQELEHLLALARRSLDDARLEGISTDGRYGHAYEAARALATLIIRAEGYRVRAHGGSHYNTFLALEAADPKRFVDLAAYFNACREKRNELSYTMAGIASEHEARELLRETEEFEGIARQWIRSRL
jgi:hypothetical protein